MAKRITAILLIFLIGFFFLSVGGGYIPGPLLDSLQTDGRFTNGEWKNSGVIVVLGAGSVMWGDQSRGPSVFTALRIHEAIRLHRQCRQKRRDCLLLVSGGDPFQTGYTEARLMKVEAQSFGIPENEILLEEKSNNTFQNAEFSAELLKSKGISEVVLVTSGFHMKRAQLYFGRFGIETIPAPADRLQIDRGWWPSPYGFFVMGLVWHEWVGVMRFRVYEHMGWNARPTAQPGAL